MLFSLRGADSDVVLTCLLRSNNGARCMVYHGCRVVLGVFGLLDFLGFSAGRVQRRGGILFCCHTALQVGFLKVQRIVSWALGVGVTEPLLQGAVGGHGSVTWSVA